MSTAQQIISREDAYAQSLKTYFTGVPCRQGHYAERYTSGGNCLECLKITHGKQMVKNNMRRRLANAIESKDTLSYTMSIPQEWFPIFEKLQQISIRADDHQTQRMEAMIESMHKETAFAFAIPRMPARPTRNVTRADCLSVIEWDGHRVTNEHELETIKNDEVYPIRVRIRNEWYPAPAVMECIKGLVGHVAPFNPKDYE